MFHAILSAKKIFTPNFFLPKFFLLSSMSCGRSKARNNAAKHSGKRPTLQDVASLEARVVHNDLVQHGAGLGADVRRRVRVLAIGVVRITVVRSHVRAQVHRLYGYTGGVPEKQPHETQLRQREQRQGCRHLGFWVRLL